MAQDPEFSQYYAAPLLLNPALTGISFGPRVNLNYRNQWPSIDKGYVTFAASYDQHIEPISSGVGVLFVADRVAGGLLNSYYIQLMYSYRLKFSKNFSMRFGVSGGVGHRNIDWARLTFNDQINPVFGFVDPLGVPNISAEFNPDNNTLTYADFGAGVVAYSKKAYGGIGFKHVTRPPETFFPERDDSTNKRPLRAAIHGGYVFDITPNNRNLDFFVSPNILLVSQGASTQVNVGAYFSFNGVYVGAFYRNSLSNTDAIIGVAGFRYDYFNIGYSYDVTLSDLGTATGGSHEISFSFNLGGEDGPMGSKNKASRVDCPPVLSF